MQASALRLLAFAVISFLTLVDLFATQAILPSLAQAYGATPAAISSAVNACTLGMAIAGVIVAYFNRLIPRRRGIALSLLLLAIPTLLLATMPPLPVFAALRIIQGFFMSAAFSLTIAYLAETSSASAAAEALAAYVTGNVASNLVGRLMSAAVVEHFGLASNFLFFAALNVAGAAFALAILMATPASAARQPNVMVWRPLFRRAELLASFAIGFLILFVFIGTFTYVNFVLARDLGLSRMQIGFVYFVFVPSIMLTPFAGRIAVRYGARMTIIAALGAAATGLPLLLAGDLKALLAGLAIVAAGTFFAQAAAAGYVSRAGGAQRGAAGGVYLASYYSGGLAGTLLLGQIFDRLGWTSVVVAMIIALCAACFAARRLTEASALRPPEMLAVRL